MNGRIDIKCNEPNCNCLAAEVKHESGETVIHFKTRHRGKYHEQKIKLSEILTSFAFPSLNNKEAGIEFTGGRLLSSEESRFKLRRVSLPLITDEEIEAE